MSASTFAAGAANTTSQQVPSAAPEESIEVARSTAAIALSVPVDKELAVLLAYVPLAWNCAAQKQVARRAMAEQWYSFAPETFKFNLKYYKDTLEWPISDIQRSSLLAKPKDQKVRKYFVRCKVPSCRQVLVVTTKSLSSCYDHFKRHLDVMTKAQKALFQDPEVVNVDDEDSVNVTGPVDKSVARGKAASGGKKWAYYQATIASIQASAVAHSAANLSTFSSPYMKDLYDTAVAALSGGVDPHTLKRSMCKPRSTLRKHIQQIHGMYKNWMRDVYLPSLAPIALTADGWRVTFCHGKEDFAITAHGFNEAGKLYRVVVDARIIENGSGLTIAQRFEDVISSNKRNDDVSGIVTDGAAANRCAVDILRGNRDPDSLSLAVSKFPMGEMEKELVEEKFPALDRDSGTPLFHVWCCCHKANLCLLSAFKGLREVVIDTQSRDPDNKDVLRATLEERFDVLDRSHDVACWARTNTVRDELEQFFRVSPYNGKVYHVRLAVPTRFYSWLEEWARLVYCRKAFDLMFADSAWIAKHARACRQHAKPDEKPVDPERKIRDKQLTPHEYQIMAEVIDIASPIVYLINELEGDMYVTSNRIIPLVEAVYARLLPILDETKAVNKEVVLSLTEEARGFAFALLAAFTDRFGGYVPKSYAFDDIMSDVNVHKDARDGCIVAAMAEMLTPQMKRNWFSKIQWDGLLSLGEHVCKYPVFAKLAECSATAAKAADPPRARDKQTTVVGGLRMKVEDEVPPVRPTTAQAAGLTAVQDDWEKYLEEPRFEPEGAGLDPMLAWNSKTGIGEKALRLRDVHPYVYQMARYFLAIPASSCSAERAFRFASALLTKKTNRLGYQLLTWLTELGDAPPEFYVYLRDYLVKLRGGEEPLTPIELYLTGNSLTVPVARKRSLSPYFSDLLKLSLVSESILPFNILGKNAAWMQDVCQFQNLINSTDLKELLDSFDDSVYQDDEDESDNSDDDSDGEVNEEELEQEMEDILSDKVDPEITKHHQAVRRLTSALLATRNTEGQEYFDEMYKVFTADELLLWTTDNLVTKCLKETGARLMTQADRNRAIELARDCPSEQPTDSVRGRKRLTPDKPLLNWCLCGCVEDSKEANHKITECKSVQCRYGQWFHDVCVEGVYSESIFRNEPEHVKQQKEQRNAQLAPLGKDFAKMLLYTSGTQWRCPWCLMDQAQAQALRDGGGN